MNFIGKVDILYPFPLEFISMKFRDYIDSTHVFTSSQLASSCELSESSIKTTLRRAIDTGQIERVRRGVYVSKSGQFVQVDIDSFELVSAIDTNAVLSFHSALEVHGVAHNVSGVCQFRSSVIKSPFIYSGISYVPFSSDARIETQTVRGRGRLRVNTTSREQTIVDCLTHPDRCGGIEEALTSISLFPYIDVETLRGLVSTQSASLAARVGWLLEQKTSEWRIPPEALTALETMAKGGPFRLDKNAKRSRGWSSRWGLCLPEEEEEIRQWLL